MLARDTREALYHNKNAHQANEAITTSLFMVVAFLLLLVFESSIQFPDSSLHSIINISARFAVVLLLATSPFVIFESWWAWKGSRQFKENFESTKSLAFIKAQADALQLEGSKGFLSTLQTETEWTSLREKLNSGSSGTEFIDFVEAVKDAHPISRAFPLGRSRSVHRVSGSNFESFD